MHRCSGPECAAEGKLICTRCGAARYCSPACQRAHWRTHKDTCAEPPPPPLPPAVEAAVRRLDAAALTAALAPLVGAAGPAPLARSALVSAAVASFEKKVRAEVRATGAFPPSAPGEPSSYCGMNIVAPEREAELLLPVLRILLAHGAPPRGLVPSRRAPDCSAPLEVVLARMHCDAALALLAGAGSRLDGLCNGVAGGLCKTECCALRARMQGVVDLLLGLREEAMPPEIQAFTLQKFGATAKPFRALLAAGAGSALVTNAYAARPRAPRLAAASSVLLEAVMVADPRVPSSFKAAEAMLSAGASPDFIMHVPRSTSPLIPLQESSLLSYVLEEACNEALGLGLDAPDATEATRRNRLAARARALRTEGPCHTVLRLVLAAGVPQTLRHIAASILSGVEKDTFTHAAQMGVTHVIEALLAAGGDPNVGAHLLAHPGAFTRYETPLECAVGWGHHDAVCALLRGGARVTPRALACAGERGDAASAAAMLAAVGERSGGGSGSGSGSGAGAQASAAPHPLLQVCTHPARYAGSTPLMMACMSGAAHVVREMLQACPSAAMAGGGGSSGEEEGGGDCDSPVRPRTPMAYALLSGAAPELVALLVEAGARAPRLEGSVWVSACGRMRADLQELRSCRSWLCGQEGLQATIGCDQCGALPGIGEAGWSACGKCASVRYCGEACQRSAWKEHKVLCKELRKRPQPSA